MEKISYITFIKGHKDFKGEHAPWVIKDEHTHKILSSHKTKDKAIKHLKQMKYFKHHQGAIYNINHFNNSNQSSDVVTYINDIATNLEGVIISLIAKNISNGRFSGLISRYLIEFTSNVYLLLQFIHFVAVNKIKSSHLGTYTVLGLLSSLKEVIELLSNLENLTNGSSDVESLCINSVQRISQLKYQVSRNINNQGLIQKFLNSLLDEIEDSANNLFNTLLGASFLKEDTNVVASIHVTNIDQLIGHIQEVCEVSFQFEDFLRDKPLDNSEYVDKCNVQLREILLSCLALLHSQDSENITPTSFQAFQSIADCIHIIIDLLKSQDYGNIASFIPTLVSGVMYITQIFDADVDMVENLKHFYDLYRILSREKNIRMKAGSTLFLDLII